MNLDRRKPETGREEQSRREIGDRRRARYQPCRSTQAWMYWATMAGRICPSAASAAARSSIARSRSCSAAGAQAWATAGGDGGLSMTWKTLKAAWPCDLAESRRCSAVSARRAASACWSCQLFHRPSALPWSPMRATQREKTLPRTAWSLRTRLTRAMARSMMGPPAEAPWPALGGGCTPGPNPRQSSAARPYCRRATMMDPAIAVVSLM
uniref:Uncharacterized protein n=1 Tax=Triticum urartu TaxID=4572 RepID=A0A8R7TSE1_TRIUA